MSLTPNQFEMEKIEIKEESPLIFFMLALRGGLMHLNGAIQWTHDSRRTEGAGAESPGS